MTRWALSLMLVLWSCGGGSSGDAPVAVVPDRTDLLFGYFGDCDGCIAETQGHANLAFVMGWPGGDAWYRHAGEAQVAGMKIILAVCYLPCGGDSDLARRNMRAMFSAMRSQGTLADVAALYPLDEPDQAGLTAAQVATMCAFVRSVASEYAELANIPLAAIYSVNGSEGIEEFDWIGRDSYGSGVIVPIRLPHQRLLLVPGGVDPWREDPAPFLDVANRTPAVVAIVPFLWRWPDGRGAIATNGMARAYCQVGERMTRRTGAC